MKFSNRFPYLSAVLLVVATSLFLSPRVQAQNQKMAGQPRLFPTSEAAIKALVDAAKADDRDAVHEIFGPGVHDLLTGDPVQDKDNFQKFSQAMAESCQPQADGDGKIVLDIGAEKWPFPIPLVKTNGQWFFDTDAGHEEIINRHIGHDELNAIGVCHAYVEAQRQYFAQDRDGSGVFQYAQKFKSSPDRKDGLYWKTSGNEPASPFGPLVAEAHAEGYGGKKPGAGPKPFHGYIFKILTRQGRDASGGKMNYLVHGKMTRGFALVAYPARWNQSGIMTFIVNQDGQIYQRNLDEQTARIAAGMTQYNPDSNWTLVSEPGITEK